MKSILELLGDRHAEDVFVPECNTGSATKGCKRMDAWVMKKTWSPMTTIGYEIKVSRGDFVRDEKWMHYLPFCHQLYFVCPSGLIQKEEVPDGVGLMWQAKTGTKLFIKRKAPRREPDQLHMIMSYVLMSRARIGRFGISNPVDRVELWKEWLENRDAKQHLGYEVATKIRERDQHLAMENKILEKRCEGLEYLGKRAKELGMDPEKPINEWRVDSKLGQLTGDPTKLRWPLNRAIDALKHMKEELFEDDEDDDT